MVAFDYVIQDAEGIHARPAGLLVKQIAGLSSKVMIKGNGKEANGKKLLALMGMGIKCGMTITVEVEGDTEEADAAVVQNFLAENL